MSPPDPQSLKLVQGPKFTQINIEKKTIYSLKKMTPQVFCTFTLRHPYISHAWNSVAEILFI
jgi:hypothetical protein